KLARSLGERQEFDPINALAVGADGREVVVGTQQGRLKAWSLTLATSRTVGSMNGRITTVGYADDGVIFAAGPDAGLALFPRGKEPRRIEGKVYEAKSYGAGWTLFSTDKGMSAVRADQEPVSIFTGVVSGLLATAPRVETFFNSGWRGDGWVW